MYNRRDKKIHSRIRSAGRAKITGAKYDDLFSEQGVEIKPIEDQVVILAPHHWRRSSALMSSLALHPEDETRHEFKVISLFESSEHVIISEKTLLQFSNGRKEHALSYVFRLQNGLGLTYGQIIALAGDFYGDPDHPISDAPNPEQQFIANFQQLAANPDSVQEVKNILAILTEEFDEVAKVIQRGLPPSAAYAELGDTLSLKWNNVTRPGGGYAPWNPLSSSWVPFGRYLKLAGTNWDHFGADAVKCYTAGHNMALKTAAQATNDDELAQAYAINAFADHFLTDLFSAGHIRTPRRQLYDSAIYTQKGAASLITRSMHDEDSHWGLWVNNARGDQWVAYGDKRYRDMSNYQNAGVVTAAVQQSVNEVYQAFVSRQVPVPGTSGVFSFIPNLNADWTDRKNYSPMFLLRSDGVVLRRDWLNYLDNYDWDRVWFVLTTLAKLKALGWISGPPVAPSGTGSTAPTGFGPTGLGETGAPPGKLQATGPDVPRTPPSGPLGPGGPTGFIGGTGSTGL